MAAGVGKTYRMLAGGPRRAGGRARRRDRPARDARARRDRGAGRGAASRAAPARRPTAARRSRRWTCPAILRRAPGAVPDRRARAHQRARARARASATRTSRTCSTPASTCSRRVNVQHLESLNDQVAELSGVRVRETVPGRGARPRRRGRAHRPDARGAARRACAPARSTRRERIEAALNGFFRIENLAALREVALRQVAEEVEAKRLVTEVVGTREDSMAADAAAGRRRAAARARRARTRARSGSCAARGARRSGSAPSSTCCGSRRPGATPDAEQERQLAALRQLASVLGARPARRGPATTSRTTVARVARERGTTYVLLGRSRPARGLARLREPLPQRLMRGAARRRRADRRRPLPATRRRRP